MFCVNAGFVSFYDAYEKAELWGKDLYEHLADIYQHAARFCILFASESYAKKVWTSHERQNAQARALTEHGEYVLPARFDDTPIPGLRDTIGYVRVADMPPGEFADLIEEKLGPREREGFLPPVPDVLFDYLEISDENERDRAHMNARGFVQALQRMTEDERVAVTTVLDEGCPAELPKNVHVNVDLLRRETGFTKSKLVRLLGQVRSLGFTCSTRISAEHGENELGGPSELVVLEWHHLVAPGGGNMTGLAQAMVHVAQNGFCAFHGREALKRADFAQLASVTATEDTHGEVDEASPTADP